MFFVHPMWDSETERVGMQKCRPGAYLLHAWGELVGILGLVCLLVFVGLALYRGTGWWLVMIPVAMGLASEIMVQASWRLVAASQFKYDARSGEACWFRGGERITYRWTDRDA